MTWHLAMTLTEGECHSKVTEGECHSKVTEGECHSKVTEGEGHSKVTECESVAFRCVDFGMTILTHTTA